MDESPDITDLSFDEKIAFLEEDLPRPIQDFLRSPERDAVSLRLSQKYALHADQAGAFERAYLYMLLGVNTPDDFVKDLRDAGVAADTIRGLTTDVNEQVFKKLQGQELAGPAASTRPITPQPPKAAAIPVMQIVAPAAAPQQVPPLPPQETPSYNLIRPEATVPEASAIPSARATPTPTFRTMHSDMEALTRPEHQPATTAGWGSTMPQPVNPAHVSPARAFQTASVPYTSMPAVSNPVPTYAVPAPVLPLQKPQLSPSSIAPAPKELSSDPYREPIG